MKKQQLLESRRNWLGRMLSSAGLATGLKGAGFSRPIGAELYTVRMALPDAAETTIRAIAEIGYKEAEGDRASLARLDPILRQNGMRMTSCHLETPLITGNWEPWIKTRAATHTPFADSSMTMEAAIEAIAKAGVRFAVMAYVLPQERGGPEFYRRLAGKMNHAGKVAAAAGVQFCYHNHCYEFEGRTGERPFDILSEGLDKKLVMFELDVFWLSVAGQDPVEMIQKMSGRVPLLHLKDKARGTPVLYREAAVHHDQFKEVGSGVLDFPAILRAAEAAKVQHYFVEQDYTPGNPVDSLRTSYRYLRSVKL